MAGVLRTRLAKRFSAGSARAPSPSKQTVAESQLGGVPADVPSRWSSVRESMRTRDGPSPSARAVARCVSCSWHPRCGPSWGAPSGASPLVLRRSVKVVVAVTEAFTSRRSAGSVPGASALVCTSGKGYLWTEEADCTSASALRAPPSPSARTAQIALEGGAPQTDAAAGALDRKGALSGRTGGEVPVNSARRPEYKVPALPSNGRPPTCPILAATAVQPCSPPGGCATGPSSKTSPTACDTSPSFTTPLPPPSSTRCHPLPSSTPALLVEPGVKCTPSKRRTGSESAP